ncbi:VolA/Pla-1 family phospholipase [Photobacterium sanguinicancri]|nr:VolA/Pla-1 family phospholipase [Photobacterium sanguinicancri]MDO6499651.1 hypothetical protein [Photobacterium sanguinicancri]
MKKQLLALMIASTLGLTGCGNESSIEGDSTISYEQGIQQSLKAPTKVKFQLQGADATIPLPSFMLMDTFDGTLNIPDGGDSKLSNPKVAMGQVDGWSPNQAMIIPFSGVELEPTSVTGSVALLKVDDPRKGTDMQVLQVLTEGTDFIVQAQKDTLYIQPLKLLSEKSNYLFAISNSVTDKNGNAVGLSASYAEIKTKNKVHTVSSLKTAQQLTHLIEGTVEKTSSISADDIIYSSWFTTSSAGDSMHATKAAMGLALMSGAENVWKGDAVAQGVDISNLYNITVNSTEDFAASLSADKAFETAFTAPVAKAVLAQYSATPNTVSVIKGTIKLPSFLETSTDNDVWKTTPWESATPSLAKIVNTLEGTNEADKQALTSQLIALNIDVTKLKTSFTEQAKLIGETLTLADGSQLDKERLVTQYSPIPKIKAVVDVPFVMFKPTSVTADNSLPVMLYQHGITSIKENAYFFAANFANSNIAVIAIDHPLHGARALSSEAVTTPSSPEVYMNLEYLPVARDNIRQSTMDVLGVRGALSKTLPTELAVIDPTRASFYGHSLGAITGIATYKTANDPIPLNQAAFTMTAGAFANPGGGIPSLLLGSTTFGPTVKHLLMASASDDYKNTYATTCEPNNISGANCFTGFYSKLNAEQQGKVDADLNSFAYAAQTVLDTTDPISLAKDISSPVYLMQAEGDAVVPNEVPGSLIAGTKPLIKELGLTQLTGTVASGPVKSAAMFNTTSNAEHSTIIAPQKRDFSDMTATKEAQTHVVSFTLSQGNQVVVADANKGLLQ